MSTTDEQLVSLAVAAREHAYVPYSHFAVGAALLCEDGTIYQGANLENAAYTPSNCAERTAFFRAVFDGKRAFSAIAVVGGAEGQAISDWCTPCGVCRQVMREWCDPESFRIILARSDHEYRSLLLKELLPEGFGPADLTLAERRAAAASDTEAACSCGNNHTHPDCEDLRHAHVRHY